MSLVARHILLALFILIAMPCARAQAHPHEWIDVQSVIVLDGAQNIVAIRERWLFDDYYLALSLPDFDANKNGKLDPDELMALAKDNVENLKDFSYFTYPKNGGFSGVSDVKSVLEQGRIALSFTLKLDKPQAAAHYTYRIYDPSYYVAMLHQKTNPVLFENDIKKSCTYVLTRPKPDAVWTTLAKALDKKAVGPEDLGKYFAESVSITCK